MFAPAAAGCKRLLSDVSKGRAPAFTQRRPRILDSTNKLRVMLQTIVKPVVFGRLPN
jgi:hypothetical protein